MISEKNRNLSFNTNFRLLIDDPDADEINFFIQSVSMPSVMMTEIETPYMPNQIWATNNKMSYTALTINFVVDEAWENYKYIYRWMRRIVNTDTNADHYRNCTLHILNTNKLPSIEIRFDGAFPTSLGDIQFDSSSSDTMNCTCSMEIRYQFFEFVDSEQGIENVAKSVD